uniref:synaptotagmin-like protein 1 isoform X5 n=1 Tax=Myxine glutinosa TaxID=7769 RepID=UPI00358E0E55
MMSQLDVLDLCFLTEEEKRRIKQVLQRDIDLQKIEKKRLQRVQKKMPDVKVKKKMTGEWFSSIKDQRYRGKPDGTELVWKSMEWESGLKPGQHRKEPRVPKQTDSSLERRVPLQSTIPAHLPVKNKQVVDEFGRQRRDEPVLSVNDPTANLQSEEPSRARRNPFGEADLAAELSSGTGRSDEESSEKENEWHHADPTKERDPAGMTRPLTDSKKQLTADQSEPYAHSSRQPAEEDVRIRASSSFENQDELPPYPTSRDPVPRDWDQQVNAPPIAGGQNQNRTVSPSFDIDAPNDHYSQPPPPPVRTRMTKASNLPDDEVMTKTSSLQQRSAPRNAYENQESAASKILARSKNKMSRSLDDILESNSEDPVANAGKQGKPSDDPQDVNNWVASTVERREVGPAVRVPEKGTNLPQAAKLSRSVPVLNPSDEEAESPDSWSEGSQMSEQTPKRLGGHAFSTSSAGSITSSMMSLYSEAGDYGNVPITGEVEFALRYNDRSNELLVHISRCRDLAAANEKKKRSDAYVKTYLLPDRSRHSKRKTVIKKKTLSPKYDEVLKYKIEKSDLANRILNLSVWHNDMFGRNVFLGEVNLILNSWDWINQTLNWYSLQPKDFTIMEPIVSRGQITLGLKYVPAKSLDGKKPTSGEVHIWIQNAYNLVPVRSQGVDSFVKCYILPDTSRQSRQKTRVIRKDCNPEYNHTMVYDGFHAEDLHEACIELTIWDYERFSTNQFLGGVRLSFGKGVSYGKAVEWMDSQGEEIRLYKQLLEKPNEWNQGILPLRPQMATAQNPHK